ncbi:hypothetical protein RFI_04816 [Reticulomyxa filosa]|uniref:Uncharacterized protein n=1 Tax=Reticulomyxa filosa TaxID=46433 RepID=X6P158_RETFI|nr:hypothetical protein RFI_04816 [Reticulomyxa filosa]|eukprot:ETO32300.1 hypothetical protein RFI_04816 [Reticulomyxa filosa]
MKDQITDDVEGFVSNFEYLEEFGVNKIFKEIYSKRNKNLKNDISSEERDPVAVTGYNFFMEVLYHVSTELGRREGHILFRCIDMKNWRFSAFKTFFEHFLKTYLQKEDYTPITIITKSKKSTHVQAETNTKGKFAPNLKPDHKSLTKKYSLLVTLQDKFRPETFKRKRKVNIGKLSSFIDKVMPLIEHNLSNEANNSSNDLSSFNANETTDKDMAQL